MGRSRAPYLLTISVVLVMQSCGQLELPRSSKLENEKKLHRDEGRRKGRRNWRVDHRRSLVLFSTMYRSAIPYHPALGMGEEQTANPRLR